MTEVEASRVEILPDDAGVGAPGDQIAKVAARSVKTSKKRTVRLNSKFDAVKNQILETFNDSKQFCQEIAELYDIIKIPDVEEAKLLSDDMKKEFAKLEMKKRILCGLGGTIAELSQEMCQFQQYVFRKFVRPSRAQVAKLATQLDLFVERLHNLKAFCATITRRDWEPPRAETNPNYDHTHVPQSEHHDPERYEELLQETKNQQPNALAGEEESVNLNDDADDADDYNADVDVADDKNLKFEEASEFQGSKEGYVFRTGSQGLGYYEDK